MATPSLDGVYELIWVSLRDSQSHTLSHCMEPIFCGVEIDDVNHETSSHLVTHFNLAVIRLRFQSSSTVVSHTIVRVLISGRFITTS